MNAFPIGGGLVAPDSPVGLFEFVDLKKFVVFPLLFLSLQIIFQWGRRYPPVVPAFVVVISVNCILSYLVRLNVSIPTDTLR